MKRKIFTFVKIISKFLSSFLLGYGVANFIRHEQYVLILIVSVLLGLIYVELKRKEIKNEQGKRKEGN